MPPPVTPSPHRFVIKREAPPRKTPLAQEHRPPSSTQQFNATPRFTVSSTPQSTATHKYASSTPAGSRYLTPGRNAQREREVIDISSSDDRSKDIYESIETEGQAREAEHLFADDEDGYAFEEPGPKRRRLSSTPTELKEPDQVDTGSNNNLEPSSPSSLHFPSSPPAPRRAVTTAASRFLTPAPPSTPIIAEVHGSTFRKPPTFRPPDPSEQPSPHKDPLPDHFSPQKGGRKYIPGGLAKELQGWLVSMESALPSNADQRNRDDPWLVRIAVDEVSGAARAGPTMIGGKQVKDGIIERGNEMKVILAGEGTITGLQKVNRVEAGKMVGIKGPVWEVMLEGQKWGVAVDWKVLRD